MKDINGHISRWLLVVGLCCLPGSGWGDIVFEMPVHETSQEDVIFLVSDTFTSYAGLPQQALVWLAPLADPPSESGFMAILDIDLLGTRNTSGNWTLEWISLDEYPTPGAGEIIETGTWQALSSTITDEWSDPDDPSAGSYFAMDFRVQLSATPGTLQPDGYPFPFDWGGPMGAGQYLELTLAGSQECWFRRYGNEIDFDGTLTGRIVPEPATFVLFGLGLVGMVWRRSSFRSGGH